MEFQDITFDVKDGIATVTMNRPTVLNALTKLMIEELQRASREISERPDVRVGIFTGAGRGFCSGADLRLAAPGGPLEKPYLLPQHYWTTAMEEITKPTIAAINGVAVGGGLAIALTCDIRIASDQARMATQFSKIGQPVLDGTAGLLPRAVGLAKALELLYTSEMLDAREAERIGLVSYVVPQEQLMPRALEMARTIAEGPPLGIQLSKWAVMQSLHKDFKDALPYQYYASLVNSTLAQHDVQEGAQSFKERRPPKFKGLLPPEQRRP